MNKTLSSSEAKAKTRALLTVIEAVDEAVRAVGPGGVSEGTLYASLMAIPNFRVDHLDMILTILERAGKITRSNFLVKAVR
jgi:hypothetical protein